jgi:hypothetical protein
MAGFKGRGLDACCEGCLQRLPEGVAQGAKAACFSGKKCFPADYADGRRWRYFFFGLRSFYKTGKQAGSRFHAAFPYICNKFFEGENPSLESPSFYLLKLAFL